MIKKLHLFADWSGNCFILLEQKMYIYNYENIF